MYIASIPTKKPRENMPMLPACASPTVNHAMQLMIIRAMTTPITYLERGGFSNLGIYALYYIDLCAGEESNLHALRHTHLKRTCIPFHHPRINLLIFCLPRQRSFYFLALAR